AAAVVGAAAGAVVGFAAGAVVGAAAGAAVGVGAGAEQAASRPARMGAPRRARATTWRRVRRRLVASRSSAAASSIAMVEYLLAEQVSVVPHTSRSVPICQAGAMSADGRRTWRKAEMTRSRFGSACGRTLPLGVG